MGYYSRAYKTAWTVLVIVYTSVNAALATDTSLITDLGLDVLPDKAKINISLEEYTSVISTYLKSKDDTFEPVPELRVYRLDNPRKQDPARQHLKMLFPISPSTEEIESAALRLLLPPQRDDPLVIKVNVNQIIGTRRRRFIQEQTFYLSKNLTKWCDVDVTDAVSSWTRGQKNVGLELVCVDCRNNLNPEVAAVTALVHTAQKRKRRSTRRGKTDCSARHEKGNGKKKCCRHELKVTFLKLPYKEMVDILEPKTYDAFYCQGICPPNYNYATNHSRIQGLMHQIKKKEAKLFNETNLSVPKTCCAPSKLGSLEIMKVGRENKLVIETWENMQVLECACS